MLNPEQNSFGVHEQVGNKLSVTTVLSRAHVRSKEASLKVIQMLDPSLANGYETIVVSCLQETPNSLGAMGRASLKWPTSDVNGEDAPLKGSVSRPVIRLR